MADDKLNTGPGEKKIPEAPEAVTAGQPQALAPEQAAAPTPQQEQAGPAKPDPGDVVVSFEQINELMGEKRKAAQAEVEKVGDAPAKEQTPGEAEQPAAGEQKKPRRSRSPKEDKTEPAGKEAAKPRKGRPPKADKAAPGEAQPSKRDKVSRSDGKAPDAKTPPKAGKTAPEKEAAAPEQAPPGPAAPPRPVEEGKLMYLKLSEMHPFHTFRPHPFKVRDDAKMQETVASIKSIAEVEQLIAQSMVLSKVGKMDSADATKNLTSAMKGYGLAVDEVSGIVDKLTAIDLKAAVSSADLAVAMSRTANSANIAGVSMDRLLGYLATIQEVTQKSAETVGESVKSMFARINNIKLGKFIDDNGESLNDTEKILKEFGIALRDTEGEFRAVSDVLDELYGKWDSFTSVEKSAIAVAAAGTRQRENFFVLMENYGKALEYAEVATNSEGTAMKKFAAYQESVEAHFNSLIASAEALSKQTFPPELLNGFIDAGAAVLDFLEATNLLTIALSTLGAALTMKGLGIFGGKIKSIYQSVSNLSAAFNTLSKSANVKLSTEQFNQLLTVTKGLNAQQLKLVVSNKALTTEQRMMILTASGLTKEEAQQTLATMGLATAEGAATTATFSLSGAFKALGAAIAANPIGFLVMALTTAVTVISTVNSKLAEAKQEIIDTGNEAAEHANNLIELADSYFALADAVDAGTAAKEDMLAAQDDIIKALGLEGRSVDELIAKYGDLQTAIKTITLDQLDTDISQAIKGAKTAKKESVSDLETYLGTGSITSNKDSEKAIIKWLYDQGLTSSKDIVSLPHSDMWDAFSDPSFEDLKENRDFLEQAMNAVRKEFGSDNDVFNALSKAYDNYADALDPAVEAIDNANKLIAQYYVAAARGIDDPKTKGEFEQFKKNIIEQLNSDFDFDENGSFTAEGLVDSILQSDRLYSQFYQNVEDALDKVESKTLSHSEKIKDILSNLWNVEGFEDTKKSILELANSLAGITADNIKDLVSSSGELAALLEQDGMSARFLAHVLQTEAMGGDGFALITDDALILNEALEGLHGRFDEVTDAKSRYDAAMKAPEKDTDFKSYADAFKELNEQFVAGTTNSNAFWAAAEFLFGADQLQAWGWADGLDEIYSAMQKNVGIFKDADSAGAGFLDRLYAISEAGEIRAEDGPVIAEIQKLSDGSYDFQFDSGNLDLLADKLGITSEAALACMEALSMYGDVNFYDIDKVMKTIEEIGLASDSLNGTAVNVGTLTDQLISLGYTNKDIYDLLNVLREVDGVTLLDANANVETLVQSLSDLGLATQDGVEVTINADGLAELMSQLNFTKEDTQGLITKLGEADNITLTNAQGEVVSLQDALKKTDELSFASVTSELDGITNSADLAQKAVDDLQKSINTLKGKTVTVTVDVQRKNSILGGIFGYAKGTSNAPEGDALVGEKGEELVQSGDRAYLVGTNGPEIIIKRMYANSQAWASSSPEKRKAMHEENKSLAAQLSRYGIVAVTDGSSWYVDRIGGQLLYDKYKKYTYHSGGIVGDDPTLKQDEVFAKLKKGEAVFTEEQQKPVYQALDFAETMLGKYGKVLSSISGSDLMGVRMQEQIKQDTQQAQNIITHGGDTFDIDVPMQIYPLQKLDDAEIKSLTKKISSYTIKELDGVFALRGMRSLRR